MSRTFDGDNDYLETSHNSIIDVGAADFSIVLWLKSSTGPAEQDRLFSKGTTSGGTGGGVRYEFHRGGSTCAFAVDDNSTKSEAAFNNPSEWSDGAWHHWIFERDYGTSVKVFIDASQEGTGADNTGNINNGNSLLIAAGRSSGDDTVGNWWPATIAEFALFKRVLTAAEKGILVDGFSPLLLNPRPVFYVPLIGALSPEIDVIGGLSGTVNGAVAAAHPRVFLPFTPLYKMEPVGGVATSVQDLIQQGIISFPR